MELEKQYTDVVYATKKKVAEQMGYHLIEPVWKQIEQYRSQYMVSFGDVELCLCPGILKKMIQLKGLLYSINLDDFSFEELIESENGKWLLHHFLNTDASFEQRLEQLCLQYHENEAFILHVHQKSPSILSFVMWCIHHYGCCEFGILLLVLKCTTSKMLGLLALIEKQDYSFVKQRDLTYGLDECLSRWIIRAQKSIFSQQHDVNESDLIYRYPQLKDYQIQFYLRHHTPGFFYTIDQFIQFSDVCYETGRTSMEQLVDLGFYLKLKQGKKFVYTAR